jgi:hypothetical protein
MGTPAVSGLTTMGSSTAVVSTTNGRRAVADSAQHQRELFTNWVVPYGGLGKELPTVWSFELSGGDIVQRVFGQCLGKVQAANGADFDSGNEFGKSWVSNVRTQMHEFECVRFAQQIFDFFPSSP